MSVKRKREEQEVANRNDDGKDCPKDGNLYILIYVIDYIYYTIQYE